MRKTQRHVKAYFCDAQSPWQRGSNENTNGLLRQYLPKKVNFSGYSQSDLDQIALRLSQRPRKTLGFETSGVNYRPVLHRPLETTPFIGMWTLQRRSQTLFGKRCSAAPLRCEAALQRWLTSRVNPIEIRM